MQGATLARGLRPFAAPAAASSRSNNRLQAQCAIRKPSSATPHGARPPLPAFAAFVGRQALSSTLQSMLARANSSSSSGGGSTAAAEPTPSTAKECVERGLELFAAGEAAPALRLFLAAQQLRPSEDEARAACYNAACAQARLGQWQAAVDSITRAVNDHELKLQVALKDPDLAALRERREWLAGLANMRGGINEEQYMRLRSEAKAPFRLTRIIFFGGLAVGAALGLFIITSRLLVALQGGEGAPDLNETIQNFWINAAAVAVLGGLVYRDLAAQRRDQAVIEREEALGRLQVSLGDRVVPLAAFRGTTRPVIIAGSKGQVSRAVAGAEPFREALRARGVSIIPIQLSGEDAGAKLKQLKAEFAGSGSSKGFGAPAAEPKAAAAPAPAPAAAAAAGLASKDRRWQLRAAAEGEWAAWVAEQKRAAGIAADAVYVQVQLDGTVRSSGVGAPSWQQLVEDLPTLDSVRTKIGDGKAFQ